MGLYSLRENGNQVINTNIQSGNIKYNYSIDLSNDNQSAALILNKIRSNSKVLEFGPAIGNMTRYMNLNLNCQVDCVEIDPKAASIVQKYANKMIVDDLDTGNWYEKLIDERYDYIIFADVLEHLRYPKKALSLAKQLLKEDGEILISVPNISHNAILLELLNDKFFYQKEGLLDETHIHFFTEKSLKSMIEECELLITEQWTTKLNPQETEFQVSFDGLPSEIAQYLKSRKNGNTYQFIYLLKSHKNVDYIKIPKKILTENHIDYLQLYTDCNSQFTEKFSSRINLLGNNEVTMYRIDIPEMLYGKLRLDVGTTTSYFEIKKLILENEITNERIEHDINLLEGNEDIVKLEKNSFLSIGNDPYFYTQYNIEQNQKYSLYIEILYLPSYTETCKYYLKNYILSTKIFMNEKQIAYDNLMKNIIDINNDRIYYEKKYYEIDKTNQENIKKIKNYQILEKSLKENIVRLEKELESIKKSYLFRVKNYLDKIKKR